MKTIITSLFGLFSILFIFSPLAAQKDGESSIIEMNYNFNNLLGFSFDQEKNGIVAYQILPVTNSTLIAAEQPTCDVSLIEYDAKEVSDYKKRWAMFGILKESCPEFAKFDIETIGELSKDQVYILIKFLFPIDTPNNKKSYVLSVEPFSLSNAEGKNQPNFKVYEFCCQVKSADHIDSKYPFLGINKQGTKVFFKSKADGLLGKNPRLFTEVVKFNRNIWQINSLTSTPFIEQQNIEYKSHYTAQKYWLTNHTIDKFAGVSHKEIEGDAYYINKNFNVVLADATGKIFNSFNIEKNYLKKVNSFVPVYNLSAEVTGGIMVLDHQVSFKKSLKDPVENNYHILKFDFDGNVFINKDCTYGNPENSRCFNPAVVFEVNDKLKILNLNYNKALNPISEYLELNKDGSFVQLPHQDITNTEFIQSDSIIIRKAGDHYLLIGLIESDAVATPQNTTPTPPPFKYQGYIVSRLDINNMQLSELKRYNRVFNEFKSLDCFENNLDKMNVIFNTDLFSHFIKMVKGKPTEIFDAFFDNKSQRQRLIPKHASNIDVKPYSIDWNNRLIYFINSTKWNGNRLSYTSFKF